MEAMHKSAKVININSKETTQIPLSIHVKQAVEHYFAQLNGHETAGLYAMVISEVEKPLLEITLQQAGYNQTKAAKVLGLSRSTLRKKLEQYGLS
ncbi:MAG: DNA-binding transcriptional regulator Fis [Methylicorpusculum sp.]|uniref:DNA-binding transcriptional regulator Fis n=1 Tax=Methylicorpusculum TaxID=2713642 RepID=UPI00135A4FCD|nr:MULTISPECIES: DNA-binding transcriptional regulator Fis [Methylicorpusculum]MCD2450668.1 DNA-binding transcriptional regulator Fis [Methylicorpusculum oleiharenae]MDO8845141.1 DNA-binding transcriptional regulator Fis [Methylicorpusculum sp.]MDO8938902.1 DNA-binding transcriptional regulator Fis [Methylicorpusculum sp.]MDO9239986.1 DNA-binding transcriptional regulator Fis [Methylicorpusculum sp.]MDP2178002.1 DNA-binding transcriptional regulator Fis [Methylicorpusculum sp.]